MVHLPGHIWMLLLSSFHFEATFQDILPSFRPFVGLPYWCFWSCRFPLKIRVNPCDQPFNSWIIIWTTVEQFRQQVDVSLRQCCQTLSAGRLNMCTHKISENQFAAALNYVLMHTVHCTASTRSYCVIPPLTCTILHLDLLGLWKMWQHVYTYTYRVSLKKGNIAIFV